jgi:hypothetical protein
LRRRGRQSSLLTKNASKLSEEAQATYDALVATYSALGYELIPLPLESVEKRAQFVLAEIGCRCRTLSMLRRQNDADQYCSAGFRRRMFL